MKKIATGLLAIIALGLMAFSCETKAPVVKPVRFDCDELYKTKDVCDADVQCMWKVKPDGTEKCGLKK